MLGVDAADEPYSLDNERPAHVVDVPAFRIGRVPVTNAEWRQFVDDGGYTEPRWWSPRGWEHRLQAGLTAPQFWNLRRHPHPVRPRRGHPRRRAGAARHLLRGRGLRGLGRCPAAHRDRSGRRPAPGIPATGTPAPLPVGRREPTPAAGQPRWRRAAAGAGRRLPGGRIGLRRRADARRRLGVDHLAAAAVARVHPDDLRAVLAAVLRRRLPGAARRIVGGGVRHPAAQLPQLGPPDPSADLLRCRGWRGTSDVPSSRLAGRAGLDRRRWCSTRRMRSAGAVVRAAPAEARTDERRRLGRRASSTPRACPRRWRSAAPLWGDASFASVAPALRSGCVVAAVRSATVGMPIEASATAPFTDGQLAAVAQRCRRPRGAAGRLGAPNRSVDSAMLAALIFDARPGRAGRHHRRGRARRSRRAAEHLGRQRFSAAGHHLGGHLVGPAPRRRRGAGQRALRRRPRLGGRAGPPPGRSDRAGQVTLTPLKGSSMTLTLSNHLGRRLRCQALRRDVLRRAARRHRSRCRPSGSTIRSAVTCSTRSPGCRSTTRPAPRRRSCAPSRRRSPRPAAPTPWSSSAAARRRRPGMLLTALRDSGSLRRFVPFDVDASVLESAGAALAGRVSRSRDRRRVRRFRGAPGQDSGRRPAAVRLPRARRSATSPRARARSSWPRWPMCCDPGDSLLLGTDLVKDTDRLVRAYDDSAGVTARFNRNVLAVVNRELDADFDLDAFEHVARWNADEERIEMWLRATLRSGCTSAALGPDRRLRGRRGDAHRGVVQVPSGGRRRRTGRGRAAPHPLVDRRRPATSACRWR